MKQSHPRPWWRLTFFVFVMLVVEFLDEFAYSALEAARPLIRDSFTLSYVQLGLISTFPILIAIVIEPLFGLFADSGKRHLFIVGGGIAFGLGLVVQGLAPTFTLFLVGAALQAPASGVFVNLAQASLVDDAPQRRENRMALWTLSGSVAVVIGPLALTAVVALGASWRPFFMGAGILSILVSLWIGRLPTNQALRTTAASEAETDSFSLTQRVQDVGALLKSGAVWRWLLLLEVSDLMLDVFFGLLALYMVDVVQVSEAQAGLAIAVWTGVGLVGDFLLIPLLERIPGVVYLRFSALMEAILFPLFLLTDNWWLKVVLLGMIGLFNAGWYAILQGKLYDALGEQSGSVLIVGNVAGLVGALMPLLLGTVAELYGLSAAMWLLWISPLVLFLALPRQ